MAHQAYAVIDLGFGDSGKGTIVDYLARKTGSDLVVRFNGGAQAGHNVVTPDGRHHCFSQFGSGTFVEGVRTLLTSDVAIHPLGLQKEAAHLRQLGVPDALNRLLVDERCLVITPYHQALNCLKELSRGKDAHGSCGIGYGETVSHAISSTGKYGAFSAFELHYPSNSHLEELRDQLLTEVHELLWPTFDKNSESDLLWKKWYALILDKENVNVISKMFLEIGRQIHLTNPDGTRGFVQRAKTPIFEGAQGVLLDEEWGFPPYYTWSNTTGSQITDKFGLHPGDGAITTIGVVRAFPTRHGAGPFPTEDKSLAEKMRGDHNLFNPWQGNLRVGHFDHVLNRYAMQACRLNNFPIKNLAVTHLDGLRGMDYWTHCELYNIDQDPNKGCTDAEALMWAEGDKRTEMLSSVVPFSSETSADEHNVIRNIESYAGIPVVIKSTGPTAKNKVSLL
jgi:adenylosuccinate synthase